MQPNLCLEKHPRHILPHFDEIISLANSERDGLGFLPEQALREAISRGKMLVLRDPSSEQNSLLGYLLYSGIFPYAKVQQLATLSSHRRRGIASALLRALISDLEQLGFLTLRADVAENLPSALSLYEKNQFERVGAKPGGASRRRQIVIYIRQLDTDTLFSRNIETEYEFDLGIRARSAGEAPFIALDLNVYFDLARNRSKSATARRLFGAALAHRVHIAVANEFVGHGRDRVAPAPPYGSQRAR